MKTLIAILTAAALLSVGAQRVSAHGHDSGWATTGKVLTGLVIGGAVAQALTPPPPPPAVVYAPAPVVAAPAPAVVYTPAPVVAPAPVYVQPAPVVVYAAPAPYYVPRYYYGPPVVSFRFGYGGGHYHHR
jgi:hypothetical protein